MVEEPVSGSGGRHREIHKLPKQDISLGPREDALAQSINRAREVYKQDGLYNEVRPSLLEVIKQNKEAHPSLFNK